MSSSDTSIKNSESNVDKKLVWKVHPLLDKPNQSVFLIALLFFILFLIRLGFPQPGWTTLATVILFLSLSKYFIATTYVFDDKGITVIFMGIKRRFIWEKYRRYEACPHGLFLSPFPSPNRLDNFRGLYLLYGKKRNEVIKFVKNRLQTT